jgi:hypothetical protein
LLLLSIKFKIKHLHPDTRICSPSKSCTWIQKWLRAKFYRDRCAGGFDSNPIPGFDSGRSKTLYRDGACMPSKLYPDRQKLRHASLITALVGQSS